MKNNEEDLEPRHSDYEVGNWIDSDTSPNTPEIEISKGDISKQEDVDCIVNAAHEALLGGGGVDGAIHRMAGPGLLSECAKLPSCNGVRCPIGQAKITSGHRLKAKYVIHTVSPRFVGSCSTIRGERVYKSLHPGAAAELADCYRNAIRLAKASGIKRIAFPSLGTGGHAWPVELACPVAIQTVKDELKDPGSITMVRFVLFVDSELGAYLSHVSGTGSISVPC